MLSARNEKATVADPPNPPTNAATRVLAPFNRGVRAIARHRVEHELPADVSDLGPEPKDDTERSSWREARGIVGQVQQRLGRSVQRDHGLDRGLER